MSISASDHVSAVFSIYKVLCLESNLLKSTTVSTRVKIEKRNGFVLFYFTFFFSFLYQACLTNPEVLTIVNFMYSDTLAQKDSAQYYYYYCTLFLARNVT